MNNDNLKSLRQTLLDSGYDTPEYDVFAKDMEDEENLKGVYETLKKEGYTPPEYDKFKRDMGWAEPAKPYNPSEDTMGAGVGAAIGNAIANPQPQPEPQPKAQPAAKQGGYTPTWQEQMAMGITASRAAKTAKNATSGIDQQVQNQQTYQENVFSQTPEIGRQGHVVSDGEGYITDDATKHNVLVDANKQQQEADSYLEAMRKQREEYTEPTLWDSVSKSIGSGFIRVGTGILNSLQQLSSGMIVEDASKPTGYTKTQSYDEQLRDKNNAVTRGINSMHETADRLSRQAQPRNGKGFLDMLWDGDILGFLQKGVATAGESLPMTLSAFNPYTMVLNGISLAGNNYREQTLENPDIPEWKRFSMAVGSAAIEQAVEKYADPVFKYIGGGKILKKAGKEASEEITKEVTKKATENLAKRIYKGMGGLAKDAAGEGIEEVVTNFGNDALGEILDKLSRNDEYGLEAQWAKMRKENPNATLWDFAQQKAKENVESFIGGAMAGAYTAGTTQLTTKGIEYGLNHMLNEQQIVSNPNAQLNPASVDIAQSFDEGYTLDNEQDIDKARAAYEEQRQRATEIFGEIRGLDEQPLKTIETMQQGGFTPEQIQAAYDYISAKATFDGVQQRMTEDTKRSRVDSYNVSGNTIEELDSEGNVIGTHEYENQDEMKLGLFELQQTRANNDMLADRAVMILDPKYDYDTALASFAEETGVDPEYLESIIKTDPMERTEAEQQMVSEFAETIHNILYDNTTLHEDQSAEDGADLAEMMGIDLDDADGTQAQQITDSYNAASTALNELFARNEDLKQEVQSREQQGMPHQGIIASLDSFRPEDVQTVTDFYNQQAKFNGFLNRMSQKIGEEAANRRQRHTLNGTINGQADVRNVHTITDGTNTYYLVSGNITTDSSGRITDSDSGLIIGMDEDGNFVNIGDTNGYSVMPVTQSLDQWEEGERTRLQEEWTAKIDPTGSMMQPQPAPETAEAGTQEAENVPQTEGSVTQQPVLSDETNEYGKRFVISGDGSTTFGTITPESGLTPAPLKLSEGEDTVDEEGNHHGYGLAHIEAERGDQIRKAGYNSVQEFVETVGRNWTDIREGNVIAGNQTYLIELTDEHNNTLFVQLSKDGGYWNINSAGIFRKKYSRKKPEVYSRPALGSSTSTDATGVNHGLSEGATVTSGDSPLTSVGKDTNNSDTSQVLNVKVDKNGVKLYEEGTPVDQAIQDIQNDGFDVDEMADAYIAEAQEAIDKINKKETKKPQDLIERKRQQGIIDYYNDVKSRYAELNQPAESEEIVNVQSEAPNNPGNDVPLQEKKIGSKPKAKTVDEERAERIKALKEQYGDDFDDDFTKAHTAEELASMYVGRNRTLSRESIAEALGYPIGINTEEAWAETLLAKKGEGKSTWDVAHAAWQSDENPIIDNEGNRKFNDQEIHDALISVFQNAKKKSDIMDFAVNGREEEARRLAEGRRRQEEEQVENAEQIVITDEEMAAINASLPFSQPTDEEIPEDPNNALWSVIREVTEDGNMPPVRLVDTAQMTDRDWANLASQVFEGAFVEREEVETVRSIAMQNGVVGDDNTGVVDVFSGAVTPETLREKLEQIKELYNGTEGQREVYSSLQESRDSDNEGARDEVQNGAQQENPAAEAGNGSENQGSPESVEDSYLQPRNAEEEQIIANVLAQLQQEIGDAVENANKARAELAKARAKENDRATDMFANDQTFAEPDAIFSQEEMGLDTSAEGVERRTAPQREKLQEATNKLNRLQSIEERNSRIRGALDNYRRQTTIETDNPIEAIEQAAQQFRKEQEEKKAYGSDNKLVTKDRYEELKKRMRDKLLGQMNLGVDPEILSIGTEMAVYHIEAGARKFIDYANNMINDLGDAIRPYLKAFYEGARRLPEMAELSKEMDSVSDVDAFDVLNYDKQPANTVNEHKEKNNEPEKVVSSQQNTEETVERKAEDADKYRVFSQAVAEDMLNAMETGEKPYKSINDIRKKAKQVGLDVDNEGRTDILLQELVEDGLVSAARQYVNTYVMQQVLSGKSAQEARNSRDLFNDIVKLYELQPSITQRSSNRIRMGQFSTPLPMSFVADVFATPSEGTVLEPTAGNGMMVFAVPESMVHANELDSTRLDNLRAQKFKKVTDQDATQPFEGDEYDAIIANPPFGNAHAKDYDGKSISGLAEQIAINALSKMKDNGKAAIIIGGNMEYADNGAIKSDKAFFTYLYDHYNVKGVVDMDGKLFSKQGTTYPTRMILIDGRRSEEERAQTKVYPPVKSLAPKKATTFDELFDVVEELRNNNRKTNGNEVLRTSGPVLGTDNSNTSGQTNGKRRSGKPDENGSHAGRSNGRVDGQSRSDGRNQQNVTGGVQQPSGVVSGQTGAGGLSAVSGQQPVANEPATGTNNGGGSKGGNGRVQSEGSGNVQTGGRRNERVEEKRELTSDKLPYRPHNTAFSLESVAPASMVEAMDNTLKSIEKEYGNIDNFVTKELGYDSVEEMHNALAAEQVDSVAMAIWNMKKGEGMIIGDQTGVGKGRQMAALIRWACKQGKKPIFVTKDSDLFSDIYRDLVDIGSGDLRPFIFNASKVSTDKETGEKKYEGGFMLDVNGQPIYRSLGAAEQARIFKTDKLPQGYDYAVLSYTQMNTGDAISQEESGKVAKERGERGAKKGKAVKAGRPTPKADYLRRIAKDNYLLMDESQNAAGSGNTGAYFQSILKDAKAVTFASATFAKRPDTMPLYAIRTAISKAKVKTWELLMMIGKGGVTLQEIMSRAMTQAGQMVRRERDMSDVRTDWKTIDDKETAEKARRNYNNVMRAFNAIIDFQDNYIKPALAAKSMEFASMASSVSSRRGTEKAGVDNPPFVNRLYNFSKQLLLSLKVDAVVDEVAKEIEAGRHPVIALENTLESALGEYGVGDVIEDPTLFGKLKKGLDATFRYTLTDEDGNETGGELQPHELGSEGEQAYYDLIDLIKESTQGMFISPLDAITDKLENKGYRVGEISGRKTHAVLNDEGQYVVRKRENTDRKKLARDFNSGAVDVLIINKTGSTGISLHASKRFSDQRQRTMIMAQPLSDINDYMQMIGRIDRTGQVHRGYYINLGLPVPAETRFMMMLANKLKSLNANTTTSQENKDNDVDAPDLLNKYGDQVMIEYLRDNPDVYRKLGEFLRDGKEKGSEGVSAARLDEYQPKEGDARQITGRVALLSVDEQDAFYDDVTRRYNELIKYLNDTGSNDLKISVLPLNARTIDREVSSEGTAPNSGNPFADNAYVEWVDMDILKKPMKSADVGKTIEQLNPDGRVEQILSTVKKETQEKLDKENARYEAARAKAEEDIAAKTETINRQQKRTPEQKKEAIDKYASERRQGLEESHNNMVNKIEANNMRLEKYLNMFKVGDSVLVPDDLTTDTFLGSSNGIFCGFKTKDEGITPSTTLAVFATLDGRRKIEVKLSDWAALARINNMTEQNWDSAHEVTLSNWDEKIPSSSRKHGYIMTGNILQAISDTNFQGHLVTFTDDKGNVRDGILMPDKWEPSQLKGSTVPISARKERIINLPNKESVTSTDQRVTITRYWGFYTLEVPKSKKQGGEFYLDKTLLDLVDGNDFFTAGGKMRARVERKNIEAVLDRLGEMSVTLPSDRKVEFNEQSDLRSITTSDPIKAIEEAAYAFRSENGYPKKTEEELAEITERVMGIPKRFGLKGAVTQVINSRDELERMKGKVSDEAYRLIEMGYNKPGVTGLHISGSNIVVVFGEKVEDADEAELTWWHEQTHNFWHSLPQDLKDSYGAVCFNILQKYYPETFDILVGYGPSKWKNEACSFLAESIIKQYGADKFMATKFDGNGIFVNFANELRDYLKNGKESNGRVHGNSRRRGNESQSGKADADGRDNLRQGRQGDSPLHQKNTEEVDFRISDPLEAIRRAADGFRDGQTNNPANHSAKAIYDDRLNRVETVFSEAYQDAMVSLKTAQNAIAGDKEIPDSQNAYMAENLMHGKNKNEMDLFNRMFRDPLIQTINRIMNLTGMNWGDIDRYVYTKSGLERNREFFVRDWLEAERKKIIKSYEDLNPEEQEMFDRKADTIETLFEDGDIETEEQKEKELDKALQESHNEFVDDIEQRWQALKRNNFIDLNDGAIDFADYIAGLDNFIRDNIDESYVGAEHDYSGFRAMYGDEDGKYDEDEIINELMNNEDMMESENVDTLWNQIRDCTLYGLERYREAGMRTDEQIDRVEQMFHWYVPMRGFKDNMGEDMYQYFTGKDKPKSYVGGLLKHAKGRGSEANYPISTIFSMTYKAISDCNQNLVNQKFYRLCQANPNDLVILSDSWAVLNETTGEWEEVAPDIPEDADEEDVRQITEAWEESMRQLANEGKAKKIKGKEQFDYKPMDKKKQSEHIVDVRINGQPRKMIVTGNPRMAQALNGQLRFENGKNVFSKWNSAIKNFMASVFTSYSPTFALRNMFRDWTHFRTMLGVREGRGYAKQADKYYRQSLFKMVGLFKKYRNGTLDESKEMERDFNDFMDNGGITGFVFMQKIDDIQKEMEDIYKKQKAGKTIRLNNNMWEKILGAVEALNEGIENNARFATYRASRHYAGRTKARSAYDAKEITVNFNRKGAGGKTAGFKSQRKVVEDAAKAFGITSQILGEGRIFFNATVQAIATTFKNFQNADGSLNKPYIAKWAAKYALPPFLFGLALPMINKALAAALGGDDGDDDPYANLPEWTRRKNLCFYIGNGNFITIPIGQELAAFLTLGDIMAGNTYAPDLKPVDRSWDDEILGVMNTFSPVDVDTKITKGGLMEDPISEVTGRTFSVLAPLVAVEQNLGWTGRPIYREDIYPSDKYNPEYQMVYRSTNPVMVGASKLANDLSGGDDVVRGKIQVNPAIVQYLWEQYTGGPGKVFSNTISIGKDAKDILSGNESDFNIRKVEGLKAFVQQGDDRTAYYRTQAKYRKYLDDAKKLKDAVNGYKKAAETDPLAPAKLEKISASEEYVRMERILEADKELSKINKAANKAEGQERRELRRQYNQGVKEVVDELDNIPGEQ